jgi:RNA polymerase sigma-70 factor, ECF subfamily
MRPSRAGNESDMSPATPSDSELDAQLQDLLGRCAARDAAALQSLYQLIAPRLFACLTRILRRRPVAEEALQDVFVTIWQRAGQFSAERGRPMAWLTSIARYRAIDLLRRERAAPLLVAELPESADSAEPAEDADGWLPGAGLLERCLKLLTDQQRQCLELAFVGGNSHADVARLTGSPLGTVKSWIRRALKDLKGCLES